MSFIIGLLGVVAAVWTIYDVWTQQAKFSTEKKVLWSVLAVFFSIITAIVYYLMHKR